ncbi:hypothetical protein NCC78_23590, partial [Micromonospora phytophila]|nr:hypothetical protein [Micromonospora phytophila]
MTQPPKVPGPPAGEASDSAGDAAPGSPPPQLLVMPAVDGAPTPMTWPGTDDGTAWAIPVQIPAGTRGYAVFIPLVPVDPSSPQAQPAPSTPAPVAGPATGTPPRPIAETGARPPADPALRAGDDGSDGVDVPSGEAALTGRPSTGTPSTQTPSTQAASAGTSPTGTAPAGGTPP